MLAPVAVVKGSASPSLLGSSDAARASDHADSNQGSASASWRQRRARGREDRLRRLQLAEQCRARLGIRPS